MSDISKFNISGTSYNLKDKTARENIVLETQNTKDWAKSAFSNPNLLINGNLQVWQRGTSFELTGIERKYTADRFLTFHQGDCDVEKDGEYIKTTIKNNGVNTQTTLFECPDYLLGKTLTLSFYAKANEITEAGIYIWRDFPYNSDDIIKSKNIKLTQELQRYSMTFTVPADLKSGLLNIWFTRVNEGLNKIIRVGRCKLELGEVATPFVPRSYAEELALCQRYYFRSAKNLRGTYGAYAAVLDKTLRFVFCNVRYPIPMRTNPTVTIYSNAGTKDKIGEWASAVDAEQTVTAMNSSRSNEGFNCIVKGDDDTDFAAKTYAFHVEADAKYIKGVIKYGRIKWNRQCK